MARARKTVQIARRAARFVQREYVFGRELREHAGIRHAIVSRVKANLELAEVSDASLQTVQQTAAAASAGVDALRSGIEKGDGMLHSLDARVAAADARTALHLQAVAMQRWLAEMGPSSKRLVSVIMPTRNRASLLPRAIESVERQSHTNWELLIVDDGSSDDTQRCWPCSATRGFAR